MYTVLYIINSNYFALLTVAMFPLPIVPLLPVSLLPSPSPSSFPLFCSLPLLFPLFSLLRPLLSFPSLSLVPTPISEIQLRDVGELQAPQLVYAEPGRQMLLFNVQAESLHFMLLT